MNTTSLIIGTPSPRRYGPLGLSIAFGICALVRDAHAVRPFVTDDARVVGGHQAQVETWVRYDRLGLQHWALPAFGPIDPLELTLGGLHGLARGERDHYSLSAPLGQAKLLLHPVKHRGWPGLAAAGGVRAPAGWGDYKAKAWDGFAYMAATTSLFDEGRLFIHVNVGLAGTTDPQSSHALAPIWGVGQQLRLVGGLHLVGEIFSGDPYAANSSGAGQVGLRYAFSDQVQIDGTLGGGIWGDAALPMWGSLGLRFVSGVLW